MSKHEDDYRPGPEAAGMARYLGHHALDKDVEERLTELGLVGSVRDFTPATDPAPKDTDHQHLRDMGLNTKARYTRTLSGVEHAPFWLLIP